MPDKEIICKDCRNPFTFTEGEQTFYVEKGLHEPRRCKECRSAKKNNPTPARDQPLPPPDEEDSRRRRKKGRGGW